MKLVVKNRDVLNGAGGCARGGSAQGNFSATARGCRKMSEVKKVKKVKRVKKKK